MIEKVMAAGRTANGSKGVLPSLMAAASRAADEGQHHRDPGFGWIDRMACLDFFSERRLHVTWQILSPRAAVEVAFPIFESLVEIYKIKSPGSLPLQACFEELSLLTRLQTGGLPSGMPRDLRAVESMFSIFEALSGRSGEPSKVPMFWMSFDLAEGGTGSTAIFEDRCLR
jgi:hypothetical protein